YNLKKKIVPTLELLKDVSSSREVVETENIFLRGIRTLKNSLSNKEDRENLSKLGISTKSHDILTYLINNAVYGDKFKGSSKFNKRINSFIQATSRTIMTFNYFSVAPNLFVGRINANSESHDVSGISKSSYRKADIEYIK